MMLDPSLDILREQIAALGSNSNATVRILREVDAKVSATFNDINIALKKQGIKISTKTLYRYLDKLAKAGILETDDQRPKKWRIKKRFLPLSREKPPSVRFATSTEHWGSKGRTQIIESLLHELNMKVKEADIVARRVEDYANGLGYVRMEKIWKGTIRALVVEALQEMADHEKDRYNRERFENMAFKYSDIGWSWKHLENSLKTPSYHGIHLQSPGKRILCTINLRRLPDDLRISSDRGSIMYFHGLSNVFQPLTINHDMRWFFQYGVKTQFHSSRPARHLDSALACVCAVLAMCRSEVGGSQNIDHFNVLMAPFVKKMKEAATGNQYEHRLRQYIEAFISEIWRLYVARPMDPVFSSITLEYENSPIENSNIIMEGEEKESRYRDYWECARDTADVLLEMMCKKKEENTYAPIYPRVFLKVSVNSLNDHKKISSKTLETILSILKVSDLRHIPIYFVNMDSTMNKVSGSHVSYSCEIQRITSDGTEDDQRKGIMTFASLNLPEIRKKVNVSDKENFKGILSHVEELIKNLVYFDLKKRTELKSRLKMKDPLLQITGQATPPDPDHKYFDVEHSSLHIGLVGLADFFQGSKATVEAKRNVVGKIVAFLEELKTMLDNLSQMHGIPTFLSQTPARSGAYYKFFRSAQPPQEYINILPIVDTSWEEQLRSESQIHSFMFGGSVSRIYLPREELPRNSDELRDSLMKALMTNVPLFKIIPHER
ncbi:MAG: anaerobic ribonucleoside triphosphate reductase [Candidatus Bathyarchaeota archaeon BA2]|nr:MAG: anaerobic ribonucleoside triphosphate reductase [Candidatus Bathyarchaeota archaeon BA2]